MKNEIINKDVIEGLKDIPDGSVSLVFFSPPYNLSLPGYGRHDDNLPWGDYLNWMKQICVECKRILRKGGRLAINIDAITNRQEDKDKEYIRPVHYYLCQIMKDIGLLFYTEIEWVKQNAVGKDSAWGSYLSCSTPVLRRNVEFVFVWSKDQFTLEGDSEQSDMTPKEFHLYTLSAWHIQPETRKLANHPAAFPEELAKRMIKLFTYRDDLVVDCFNGTGTTTYMAALLGRRWIGIDNNPKFCQYAKSRIQKANMLIEIDYIPRSQRMATEKENKQKTKIQELF